MSEGHHGRAKFHSRGHDRDGGAGCSCWKWAALLWAEGLAPEDDIAAEKEDEINALERWHAETKAGDQGVDGLHSRDARQKTEVKGDAP